MANFRTTIHNIYTLENLLLEAMYVNAVFTYVDYYL